MEQLFSHLTVIIYLGDILGYATTNDDLLDVLEKALQICAAKGLKLSSKKCELTVKEVQFCGRLIHKDGVKFNLNNCEAIFKM